MTRVRLSCAALLLAVLGGCRTPQSTLYPGGPAAERLANISWMMIGLFLAIMVVMFFLIVLPVIRRRGTFAEHAPVDVGGGKAWIAWGGFGIPVVILTFIFIVGLTAMAHFPLHQGGAKALDPQIRLVGHQWWWEVSYIEGETHQHFKTANEIHIPVGRPVDIELRSADVIHSFWVPALHGKVDLVPGMSNYIRIQADRPGAYEGQCAEFCGAQHAHMRIVVIAEDGAAYAAWLQGQRQDAAEPTNVEAQRGRELFLAGPCSNCHQVRGTRAGGTVAPDLTHIASRRGLAANSFPNDTAHLAAWVTRAQSLKPAAAMPNITQFEGQDLRALVAYLQQLH